MVGVGDLVGAGDNCNTDYKEGCFGLCEGMDQQKRRTKCSSSFK